MTATFGRGTFSGFGDLTAEETGPADEDLSAEEAISQKISQCARNVLQIRQLVDNIGTTLDSQDLRQRVGQLQTETNALTKATNAAIKEFTTAGPPDGSHKEWKVKQTLLRENFHDVLSDYNELQKKAQRKQRQTLRMSLRQSEVMGPRQSIEESEQGTGIDQVGDIQAELDLDIIKEREQALLQLEHDIVDINDIFKDLATMVHDQGEIITAVEENVEIAETNVTVAVDELDKAESNVRKSRRKKMYLILFLCLVIGMATVVTIVIVTTKSNSTSSTTSPTTSQPASTNSTV